MKCTTGMSDTDYINMAIDLSIENTSSGKGKPFGAIVVKNGQIIGKGVNDTVSSMDPTAHSEILAIRVACKHEQSMDLTGCVIYCSSEPCPMCTAAIHLVRIARVVYSVPSEIVGDYGLSDKSISEQLSLAKKDRVIKMEQIFIPLSIEPFKEWNKKNSQP